MIYYGVGKEITQLVRVAATCRPQNIITGSIWPIPWGFLFFRLLLSCSPFYLQYIKGVQESRKQQSILFAALNECQPSRKCLVLAQNRHSCGQHPCSLSVVTFSMPFCLLSGQHPALLPGENKGNLNFDKTEVRSCLNFCNFAKTRIQNRSYQGDFSFFSPSQEPSSELSKACRAQQSSWQTPVMSSVNGHSISFLKVSWASQ